jgi:hypothetical protein
MIAIDPTLPATGQNTNPLEVCRLNRPRRRAARGAPPVLTKMALVSKLLGRVRGASIAELGAATGWQPHSVRALLSGLRKRGVRLVRETRKSGEGCYRIVANDAVGVSSAAIAAPTVAVA